MTSSTRREYQRAEAQRVREVLQSLEVYERELDKFELRAKAALEHDPRIKVLALNIRQPTPAELSEVMDQIVRPTIERMPWWLIFRIACPCGNTVQEVIPLRDLWKSKFDKHLSWLREHIHVVDGIL